MTPTDQEKSTLDALPRHNTLTTPLTNRTIQSKSPFVEEKARDKVKWQLLDEEAIEASRRDNKLIFLHIGYKACHFCYLMATESFTDQSCIAMLNDAFIPVVVDRDERPDVDAIYMNYVQAVNSAGGWPLNLFLTPELEPVFGGTYFPGPGVDTAAAGEDGLDFLGILKKVHKFWLEQETRCRKEAKEVLLKLREYAAEGTLGSRGFDTPHASVFTSPNPNSQSQLPPSPSLAQQEHRDTNNQRYPELDIDLDQLEEALVHIRGTFDPVHAGFGLAPKFPTQPRLNLLLQLGKFPESVQHVVGQAECDHAREMAFATLRRIRDGGLRDHVGGRGVARCAITQDWSVPNFEKLTVDNALLLRLFTDSWRLCGGTDGAEFWDMVTELVDYLTSPPIRQSDGAFVTSESADSAFRRGDQTMGPGAFYLWTRREFDQTVDVPATDGSPNPGPFAATYWNVQESGNVDPTADPDDEFANQNILRVTRPLAEVAKQFNISKAEAHRRIDLARRRLRDKRNRERARPAVDNKVVAGWNGLVISALARAAKALRLVDEKRAEKCKSSAIEAAKTLKVRLWDHVNMVLYRIWNGERGGTQAFADDYAFLIEGLLDLFEVTDDAWLLEWADDLLTVQIRLFYDAFPTVTTTAMPPRSSDSTTLHSSTFRPKVLARPQTPSASRQQSYSFSGGFYATTQRSPHIILRLKDGIDTTLPSTNAVSCTNLFRLGSLLDDKTYIFRAKETVAAFEVEMLQHPWLFPGLLSGVVWARLGYEGRNESLKDDEVFPSARTVREKRRKREKTKAI